MNEYARRADAAAAVDHEQGHVGASGLVDAVVTHDGNHIRYTWPKEECALTETQVAPNVWCAAYAERYAKDISGIADFAERHGDTATAEALRQTVSDFMTGRMTAEQWEALIGEIIRGRRGGPRVERKGLPEMGTTNPQFLDLIEDTAPTDDRDRFAYYLETDDFSDRRVKPGVWFLVTDGGYRQCPSGNSWHIPADRAVNHGPVWALVKESPLTGETGE